MKHRPTVLLLGALLLAALPASAREVVLSTGEAYSDNGLNVRCVERTKPQAIILTDCQFWDEFNKVCLYTRKSYHYKDLSCIEECQHWDHFNKSCFYATKCKFYPAQRAFVLTTCDVYDAPENVCRQTKQKLIR
jgi:hypothetical protein